MEASLPMRRPDGPGLPQAALSRRPKPKAKPARSFVAAARKQRRRASFFGCDEVAFADASFAPMLLGEQPIFIPTEWATTLRAHRSLREQLRRAKAKGVTIRRVDASELGQGTPFRANILALADAWLSSRPMEPMGFLVTLSLFEEPAMHRYYAAEWQNQVVAFMSLVPIGDARGWLVEDVIRARRAANGTTELLFDLAMQEAARAGDPVVTWGLAPLVGDIAWPLRVAGALGRGLYDFRGLRAFKARLHPTKWQPVYLVYPRGDVGALHVLDVLRAFAGGSLVVFGLRTVARRPLVLAWFLTIALVPWTLLLAVLLAFHAAVPLFGFPRVELFAWAAFDALFATLLVRAFWRPRTWKYAALAFAAGCDATLASLHLAEAGLGASTASAVIRVISMVAPALATVGLVRCALHTRTSA